MKKKVQLIGKVTGMNRLDTVLKFKEAQDRFEAMGFEVRNPVAMVPADATHQDAMRICLKSLLEVDAALLLPDWVNSDGSEVEYRVALAIGLKTQRI